MSRKTQYGLDLTSAMDACLKHAAGIIYQNQAEIIRIYVIYN